MRTTARRRREFASEAVRGVNLSLHRIENRVRESKAFMPNAVDGPDPRSRAHARLRL